MSATTRFLPRSAYALAKGPNGRNLCRWCKTEVTPPRRTFCTDACVHEWNLRTHAGYLRRMVRERDHGVCAECGTNCVALRRALVRARYAEHMMHARWWTPERVELYAPTTWARMAELGIPPKRRALDRSLWEADHIIPVVEGGGCCGLDNLRTLCWRCHAAASKALRARLKPKKGVRDGENTAGPISMVRG